MTRRHNVLVVGVGSIGERHLRCFQATDRTSLSLCDINDALRQQVAQRYEVDNAFATLDQALKVEHDLAVISVPAHIHIPVALQCAHHKIHLLIEKPLSTSLEDIETLKRVIAHNRLVAGVAYIHRYLPTLQRLQEELRSGRFGKPLEVVVTSGQCFPFYRPAYRDIYYTDLRTGGGAIQDALTHLVNAVEWLVGPTERVIADADHLALEGVTVEDTVHMLARHGPVMVNYSLNQHQAPNEVTFTIVCEGGTLRSENHTSRYRWATDPGGHWNDVPIEPVERDVSFVLQANQLLDAVEGQCTPVCSLEEGEHTLRVNLAALRSVEKQSWQMV